MIKLGDKVIEWDNEFRLYMTSKLANPHYSPEIMGKTMIINYSVTLQGLENQLLNVVVGMERPDLEQQFSALVNEMSANSRLLVQLEDSLLQNLANSKGNILDNEELISTLEDTKTKSVEISAKLEQAQFTKSDINKTRTNYVPAAKRGSILFFAMAGLSNIEKVSDERWRCDWCCWGALAFDACRAVGSCLTASTVLWLDCLGGFVQMYEISLSSFLAVFRRSLLAAKKDVNLDNRLRNVVNETTQQMYDYTCTGIFERHKLMFSFQVSFALTGRALLVWRCCARGSASVPSTLALIASLAPVLCSDDDHDHGGRGSAEPWRADVLPEGRHGVGGGVEAVPLRLDAGAGLARLAAAGVAGTGVREHRQRRGAKQRPVEGVVRSGDA